MYIKMVIETILYYDAGSEKHEITRWTVGAITRAVKKTQLYAAFLCKMLPITWTSRSSLPPAYFSIDVMLNLTFIFLILVSTVDVLHSYRCNNIENKFKSLTAVTNKLRSTSNLRTCALHWLKHLGAETDQNVNGESTVHAGTWYLIWGHDEKKYVIFERRNSQKQKWL
jgi:hypothetical protein